MQVCLFSQSNSNNSQRKSHLMQLIHTILAPLCKPKPKTRRRNILRFCTPVHTIYYSYWILRLHFCFDFEPYFFSLQNRQQRWPLQLRWTKLNKIQIVMERAALTWLSKLHWRNWILMSFVYCVEAILSIQRQWSNVCIHVSNHYWWPKSIGF